MKRRRNLAKKISFRAAGAIGFLTTIFSMNFICDRVHTTVDEILRQPAMMRVSPTIIPYVSPLKETSTESVNRFGLTSRTGNFAKGVDNRGVVEVKELARDYSMILPTNLAPVKDVSGVSMQIVDHTINAFFNQPEIKNTFVGRAAETVEKKLKTEVSLGGNEPDSVQHNIKFQLKASETKASMEYRGLTNCDLSYSVAAQKTNLEIFEPLSQRSNLVFTHSDTPSDRRDVLSLRMNW